LRQKVAERIGFHHEGANAEFVEQRGKQDKAKLRAEYDRLNPAQLKRDIERLQTQLLKSVAQTPRKAKARTVTPASPRGSATGTARAFA
jgi:hypothetical protein